MGRRRLGQRLLPARLALLRPDLASRAGDPGGARGDARARRAPPRPARSRSRSRRTSRPRRSTVPEEFLAERAWTVPRAVPDARSLALAAELIRSSERPLVVAGGGVIYSEATDALRALCDATGIPVGETQAGKGSLPYDHPSCLGAIGATRNVRGQSHRRRCRRRRRDRDALQRLHHRVEDRVPQSRRALRQRQRRRLRRRQARRHPRSRRCPRGARATHGELSGWAVAEDYRAEAARLNREWDAEVERLYSLGHGPCRPRAR